VRAAGGSGSTPESSRPVEHTENDDYWADVSGDGTGRNRLGQILTRVRAELRDGPPAAAR
jgi:predicted NAD-dependent protein-ADP-ribosyltransferase YbiA (DUF1768 family)